MKNQISTNILTDKLDDFIGKYYKNQLIKGGLFSVAILVATFLTVISLEYFLYFAVAVKSTLFYLTLTTMLLVLIKYIIIPVSKLLKIGNSIDYNYAAGLIGKHFPEVNDKILNTLQLHNASTSSDSSELILASINQKLKLLKPISFQTAINYKANYKYVKFAALPLLVMVLFAFVKPDLINDGTNRIINYSTHFSRPLPFELVIENDQLKTTRGEDFTLNIKAKGKSLPNKAIVEYNGSQFTLSKHKDNTFSYTFKNVQNDIAFSIVAKPFVSKVYTVKTDPKPQIKGINIDLIYPDYLKKPMDALTNSGDILIPEGTIVKWTLESTDVDSLKFVAINTSVLLKQTSTNLYKHQQVFTQNSDYQLVAKNTQSNFNEKINYNITVIKDKFPIISVEEVSDTFTHKSIFFSGTVSDDNGLSGLYFKYKLHDTLNSIKVNIQSSVKSNFIHSWNMSGLSVQPGDQLEYYFEVFDNDGVNGNKSTKSNRFLFKSPTKSELEKETEQKNEKIKEGLESSIEDIKELQKQLDEFTKKLIEKKKIDWEDKQQLQKLMDKRVELEQKLNQIQNKNIKKNQAENQLKKPSEDILKKQEQLQKLFESILDEELKKMMEEMEKMMEQLDKKDLQKKVENFNLSNEDIEKELDRTLELFKQFEFEQKLEKTIKKLGELKKEQDELAKEKLNNENKEELGEKQEKLEEKAKELEKDLVQLKEKNEALENKNDVPDTKEKMNEMKEQMKDASEQLKKNQQKESKKSQENAAEKMEEMKDLLSELQSEMESNQPEENLEDLRALLENLIQLSFDQEDLMNTVKGLKRNDPAFTIANQEQKKIKDNAQIIEDSLFALSKRVVQIEATVNKEMNAINNNMEKTIIDLKDRNARNASSRQQYIMTSANNLALLLDEIVQNMQSSMSSKKFGKKSCNKPGEGMPSLSEMKKKQQQLNKKMKKMLEQQGEGEQPGKGKKPGEKPGITGGSGQSKETAKMAAEQAAIREAIKQMQSEMNGDKQGDGGNELKKIQELMDKTEEDLVNMRLSQETLNRQEKIITKLLESEKADREQEFDNKRESREGSYNEEALGNQFLEYQKLKEKELELLKTVPPNLNQFYKNKVNEYFNSPN